MDTSLRDGMIIGMGNPLLDITVPSGDRIIKKYGLKSDDVILADKNHMPLYDEIIEEEEVFYIPGGSALNTLRVVQWILQRPNVCAVLGCIGKDNFGNILKDKAKKDGVLPTFQFTSQRPTEIMSFGSYFINERKLGHHGRICTCAVLITNNGQNRSLCANLAAAQCFTSDHLENSVVKEILISAEFYYSTGFFLTVSPLAVQNVAQIAHNRKKLFLMNLSAPYIAINFMKEMMEAMPYVDILFGNETEAATFAKESNFETNDLKEIALKIATLPKKNLERQRIVIITQGSFPVIVAKDGFTTEYIVDSIPEEKIIDTNAAGDAFVGGFLAMLAKGKSFDAAMKCGIWAGCQIIQQSGCTFNGKPDFIL